MRPTLLKQTIKSRFEHDINRPLYVKGPPGGGKTQIVKQVADELGVECRTIHAPTMLAEDCGMPLITPDKKSLHFVVPEGKFPVMTSDCSDTGFLVIDELPQADNSVQKILANLMQEREIHGHKLKPGWKIIATGNREKDRAGANRVLSHLMNRLTAVELHTHLDDWCDYYMQMPGFSVEGVSFMRFRPGLLHDFDPQRDINATPRAWVEGVFASLGKVPVEAEHECFSGDVGEGPAGEFVSFLRIYRELPDIDDIIKNPEKIKVPTDPATLYAISGALAHRAEEENFEQIMKYANRMPIEFSVIMVRGAVRKPNSNVTRTKAFTAWAVGPGAKVMT